MTNDRINRLIIVKALEEISKPLAKELVSNNHLDRKELSQILEDGLMINRDELKLSAKVLCAGFLNIINQHEQQRKSNRMVE